MLHRQKSYQNADRSKQPEQGKQRPAGSDLITGTRQILHTQLSRETVPGTRLLFALASVADKLSPVLSSRVSLFYTARQQHQSEAASHAVSQPGQHPESDWFTQRLHRAYQGLADTCNPSSASHTYHLPQGQSSSVEHAQPQQVEAGKTEASANDKPLQTAKTPVMPLEQQWQ